MVCANDRVDRFWCRLSTGRMGRPRQNRRREERRETNNQGKLTEPRGRLPSSARGTGSCAT